MQLPESSRHPVSNPPNSLGGMVSLICLLVLYLGRTDVCAPLHRKSHIMDVFVKHNTGQALVPDTASLGLSNTHTHQFTAAL